MKTTPDIHVVYTAEQD